MEYVYAVIFTPFVMTDGHLKALALYVRSLPRQAHTELREFVACSTARL